MPAGDDSPAWVVIPSPFVVAAFCFWEYGHFALARHDVLELEKARAVDVARQQTKYATASDGTGMATQALDFGAAVTTATAAAASSVTNGTSDELRDLFEHPTLAAKPLKTDAGTF